jgi:hypothetical protein
MPLVVVARLSALQHITGAANRAFEGRAASDFNANAAPHMVASIIEKHVATAG